ncbi:hypothetical protein N5J23_17810 [Comamonas aquatica]|uniref:Uncharacterized protein n=2 Tax=Comamonas aquatica TaxID=225991 RepID=A0AA43AYB2_9BURK|nr:hypothetical protein [Comamonas aquatica]MDH0202252.1 hypothetical protein [Comamonas aquatica]MDH0383338.1 hypothetical protein [Comamonas aquatica]MDH0431343.1 hypothetical protein [Comamonas aquatica]MDH0942415.1 hypothetical protein [Comamonas aquatica]MDH1428793.1 hypothetical protein [Comamonas aquatica]
MTEASIVTKVCPQCGVKVVHLEKHLKKAHDPVKITERQKKENARKNVSISQKNFQILEKARQTFLSTLVRCTSCQEQVMLKLISEHYCSKHRTSLPAEMRALYGLAEQKNMFKTTKEREEYWRSVSGISPRGDDIYDRGMTVQGGAFGLGKSRKH